jgi:hypothetical protein
MRAAALGEMALEASLWITGHTGRYAENDPWTGRLLSSPGRELSVSPVR